MSSSRLPLNVEHDYISTDVNNQPTAQNSPQYSFSPQIAKWDINSFRGYTYLLLECQGLASFQLYASKMKEWLRRYMIFEVELTFLVIC